MTKSSDDTGVIVALMKRFNELRLPRTLEIKARVEQGERLTEHDMAFLDKVFSDANHVMPLVDKHPELQPIAIGAITLFSEIIEKASENENRS